MNITNEQLIIILGVITAIAAITSIVLFIHYQKKKKLQCLFFAPLSLVNIKESFKSDITVSYKDIIINDLSMIQVIIRNSGNLPIAKEDIKVPIKFKFDEPIIECKKVSTKPMDIPIEIKIENDNEIQCSFELLNPKSEVKLQFIFIGKAATPKISSLISGVEKIEEIQYEEYRMEKNLNKDMSYTLILFFSGIGLIWLYTSTKNTYTLILGFVGVLLAIISMIYYAMVLTIFTFKVVKKLINKNNT